MDDIPRARFDTKFAIVLSDDLAVWKKLNVASFLSGGLAGSYPEVIGEAYRDGDGGIYAPLLRQPVLVFAGSRQSLRQVLDRARERDVRVAIYTEDLFRTGNDADNRAAVAAVARADLDVVGIGLYAPRNIVDKICKGLGLHA